MRKALKNKQYYEQILQTEKTADAAIKKEIREVAYQKEVAAIKTLKTKPCSKV